MALGWLFGNKNKKSTLKEDIKLWEMKKGYMVDYFFKTWQVKEVYQYDWGNGFYSYEYFLDAGDDKVYMDVENDDKVNCSVSRPAKIDSLKEHFKTHDNPPESIEFEGKTYSLDQKYNTHVRKMEEGEEWKKLEMWLFEDEEEENYVAVNKWIAGSYEFYAGNYAEEYEFTNIIPLEPNEE